jgi:hypothetical protein
VNASHRPQDIVDILPAIGGLQASHGQDLENALFPRGMSLKEIIVDAGMNDSQQSRVEPIGAHDALGRGPAVGENSLHRKEAAAHVSPNLHAVERAAQFADGPD